MKVQRFYERKTKRVVSITICILAVSMLMLSIIFAACSSKKTQESAPVKIGYAMPLTGEVAVIGTLTLRGLELALDEVNYQFKGRKLEMISMDTVGDPKKDIPVVNKLIDKDKVDFLVCPAGAPELTAIWDYVTRKGTPWIVPVAIMYDQPKPHGEIKTYSSPSVFRTRQLERRMAYNFAKWLSINKGTKKVMTLAMDNPPGYWMTGGFIQGITESGGTVVKEVYAAMGTMDFAPYLANVKPTDIDTLFAIFGPPTSISLVKAFAEYGLKDKVKFVGFSMLAPDPVVPQFGDAGLGILTADQYFSAIDTPVNKEFVAKFMKKFNEPPDAFADDGYTVGKLILGALERTGGSTEAAKVVEALTAITKAGVQAPRGLLAFDEHNTAVGSVCIAKIEKVNGKYTNVLVTSIKEQ